MNAKTLERDGTLRQQVATAVGTAWPTFAAEHPALAGVIDEQAVRDYVVETLADDAAFKQAFRDAAEAHVGAAALAALLDGFVAPVLRRLL